MSKINYVVISVAGLGSRLGLNKPKTLVDITDDKKIIDFQMELVKNIPNKRVVVGYKCDEVVSYIKSNYDDIEFFHNKGFANNSTCFSIDLAIQDINETYIALDGDLLINPKEFNDFVNVSNGDTLIGITPAKTEDGVYVNLNEKNEVISFQRNPKTNFEWANVACINKKNIFIDKDEPFLYPQFNKHLPLKTFCLKNCFEVDTPNDLKVALNNLKNII